MRHLVFIGTLLWALPSWGQIQAVTQKEEVKQSEKTVLGWHKKLILGGSLSFGSSENVIGQPNGQSNTYGLNIEGQLNQIKEQSEWRNDLKIGESASRTPAVPRYVKVKDELKIESMYLHTLANTPWFGPYVKASAETAIFKGEDVRSEAKTYQFADGSTLTGTSVRLTDGLKPLTTKESAGGFFKIITKDTMKLEARAGLGAVQVNAKNQRAVKDDASTANIEVVDLDSYEQVGFEGGFLFKGNWDAKSSYSLEGEFLTPFVANQKAGDDRSKLELTNWDVKARITSKIYEWMSVDYTARIFKQPQLLDKTQMQTLLLVSVTYQLL
ncbi:MAG: hypothetical protein AB7N80_05265 [Bdellovibrionales bacterium]